MTNEQAAAAKKVLADYDRVTKEIGVLSDFLAAADNISDRAGAYHSLTFSGAGKADHKPTGGYCSVACKLETHPEAHPELKRFSAHVTEVVVTMARVELHRLERVRDSLHLPDFAEQVPDYGAPI